MKANTLLQEAAAILEHRRELVRRRDDHLCERVLAHARLRSAVAQECARVAEARSRIAKLKQELQPKPNPEPLERNRERQHRERVADRTIDRAAFIQHVKATLPEEQWEDTIEAYDQMLFQTQRPMAGGRR